MALSSTCRTSRRQFLEFLFAHALAGADAQQDGVFGKVLAQHRFDPPLVLDEVQPLKPGNVGLRRELCVLDVEHLRRDTRRRSRLLILHDPAKLATHAFEMMDLHRLPEVLAPYLLDCVCACLHRVLVLGEQLNRLFDARSEVLHFGRVRSALEQLDLETRHQQVEPIGVFVTADAAQVLKWRGD